MATCNICKYAGTPSYKSPCSECKGFSKYEYEKLQTNADRIRAMSDEELSEFLWGFDLEEIARASEHHLEKRKITEWLQSPAE